MRKRQVARDLKIPLTNRELLRVDCHVSVFYEKKKKISLLNYIRLTNKKNITKMLS